MSSFSTSSSSSSFVAASLLPPSTDSQPSSSTIMHLPDELFYQVDSHLSFEDSHNFKLTHSRIDYALHGNFSNYDKIYVSDDDNECRISDSKSRASPRTFHANNTPTIIRMLPNLKEIVVIMKDVNIRRRHVRIPATNITECNPYSAGGYLFQLLGNIPPAELALRQLSVHVDIMIESLEDIFLQCPTEDLRYAMENLVDAQFNSFIQISICCAQIRPSDEMARNFLLQGMQYALKQSAERGAKTEFVVEPCEGYVDMTVEKGNVEYSFAFFYYNPTICDPTPEEAPPTLPLITNYYV